MKSTRKMALLLCHFRDRISVVLLLWT